MDRALKEEMDEYNSILNELKIERNGKTSYKYVGNKSNPKFMKFIEKWISHKENVVSFHRLRYQKAKPVRFYPA